MFKKIIISLIGVLGLLLIASCSSSNNGVDTKEFTTYSAMDVKCQDFCEDIDKYCVLFQSEGHGTLNDFDQFYCEDDKGERTMYPLYPGEDNKVYEILEYTV